MQPQFKSIRDLKYPALDMYASSRFSNQRVSNSKIALTKYKKKIRIQNINNAYQSHKMNSDDIQKFSQNDGMIHSFRSFLYKNFDVKKQKDPKSPFLRQDSPNVNLTQNMTQHQMKEDSIKLQSKHGLKILVCVCMYNQSSNAIYLTLKGIYKNLKHLQKKGISPGDIAVVLIQDGILKLLDNNKNKRMSYAKGQKSMINFYKQLDRKQNKKKCLLQQRLRVILDQTQNYARKNIRQKVKNNTDIPPSIQKDIALVYQNIWWPGKTKQFFSQLISHKSTQWQIHRQDDNQQTQDQKRYGLRVFSCFKHTNGTKLSSHLWFFEGFCRYLQPQFCVLLDVGTTPHEDGLLNLISGFQESKDVGGVSGFMSVDPNFPSQEGGDDEQQDPIRNNWLTKYVFSIQKAQQYQYILSHFLDKNQESILGFLHVLPGAWSAYRYEALVKSDKYEPNLLERSYFKLILNPDQNVKNYEQANMYLAQDRILSLGIYCQMDSKYVLRYVPDARADTDPMKDHQNLMKQRRRWINSSLFAFMHAYNNFRYNVMQSRHNFCRKYVTIALSMIIALLSSLNAYITPALYFFVLYVTIYQLRFTGSEWVAKAMCMVYLLVLFLAIMGGLSGNGWLDKAYIISTILAIFTLGMTFLVFWNLILTYLKIAYDPITGKPGNFDTSDSVLITVLIMLIINFSCFMIILLIHLPTHYKSVWRMIIDTPSYIAYTGAYSQTMVVHAFCNVDDVSWGTKGGGAHGKLSYQADKVFFVGTWGLVNATLAFIFIYIDVISRQNGAHDRGDVVLVAVAIYGTAFYLLKTTFAVINHFKWICTVWVCRTSYDQVRKQNINDYWGIQNKRWATEVQSNPAYFRRYIERRN